MHVSIAAIIYSKRTLQPEIVVEYTNAVQGCPMSVF